MQHCLANLLKRPYGFRASSEELPLSTGNYRPRPQMARGWSFHCFWHYRRRHTGDASSCVFGLHSFVRLLLATRRILLRNPRSYFLCIPQSFLPCFFSATLVSTKRRNPLSNATRHSTFPMATSSFLLRSTRAGTPRMLLPKLSCSACTSSS